MLRGAIMIGLAVLVFTPWTAWRGHAVWWGWKTSDIFFPFFLTVAGAGLALQTKRGIPWTRMLRRFVSLVVLGLLVNALLGAGLDLSSLRFTGVLQRIALAGLLGAGVVALTRRRWWLVTLAAVALAVLWGFVILTAAAGCPGNRPTPAGCGTLLSLGTAVLGEPHVYAGGEAHHDPEGLASTLGATASLLVGAGALMFVENRRGSSVSGKAGAFGVLGAAWLLVTIPLLLFAPFGKRMWTPAFVSVNAAAALLVLAALTLVFDTKLRSRALARARSAIAWPVVAVGRNALLSWTSLFVVDHALDVTKSGGASLEQALLRDLGHWPYLVLMLGGWTAVWCATHAARWHVRL